MSGDPVDASGYYRPMFDIIWIPTLYAWLYIKQQVWRKNVFKNMIFY